ncbi:MAG: tyrosine-type recombinase/integrase [Gaiellaceae bacterium]
MYHIVQNVNGRLVREPAGHNRKDAERQLRAVQVAVDEHTYVAPENVRFQDWCDRWLSELRREETTRRTYASSLQYAKRAIGNKPLRKITTTDVRQFLEYVERTNRDRKPPRKVSPTTLAKHLRHLGACLQAAKAERLIAENPVRLLAPSAKPKPTKKRPSYFTDDELKKLWPELAGELRISYLCRIAVATGLRLGELAALRWGDVNLANAEVLVSRTYAPGLGEKSTKSGEPRTVDLTPQAKRLFQEWQRKANGSGLIFESDTVGYIEGARVLKALYAAMERAGIPRVGERGGKRTFHSFRSTFARIALEGGAQLTWVQAQLGHSTITLTRDVYGAWSRRAEKFEAERLDGAFTL